MLPPAVASWIVSLAAGYLLLGMAFAVPFVLRWAGQMDPVAAHGTWGFRLLILPGAALLWPVLLLKRWRQGRQG